jgi:hypothetical protein
MQDLIELKLVPMMQQNDAHLSQSTDVSVHKYSWRNQMRQMVMMMLWHGA